MVTLRRCGAGIAHNATALVSVRCTVHVRYTEAPYVYSVHTLHDVIGVQPCIGWDHLAPSPGVDCPWPDISVLFSEYWGVNNMAYIYRNIGPDGDIWPATF